MKRTIAALTAVALAACGGTSQTITPDEARNALPSSNQAQIAVPNSSNLVVAPAGTEALVPGRAEYATDTIVLASAVNLGVFFTLGAVDLVVSNIPPTACAGATCTWGPWTNVNEANTWQLTVTKVDAGQFQWGLAGQPKSNPAAGFITFVSGNAFPTGVRHVGNGDFVADLDAAAKLDRKPLEVAQAGRIEVTYDNRAGASVSVKFLGTQDDKIPEQKVNAAYQFRASTSGGDLQVATRNLTTATKLTLHSRWTATGAGRGDATFFDGVATTYSRSQCWDSNATNFRLVYQLTDPGQPDDGGSEVLCGAFVAAVPPSIVAP